MHPEGHLQRSGILSILSQAVAGTRSGRPARRAPHHALYVRLESLEQRTLLSGSLLLAADGPDAPLGPAIEAEPRYTLNAANESEPFIEAGASFGDPAKVAFLLVQGAAREGEVIAPAIQVGILDAGNNVVTTSTAAVTITIETGPEGALLGGTTTIDALDGVALFDSLTLSLPGTYTLKVSSAGLADALTGTIEVAVNAAPAIVTPAAATLNQAKTGATLAVAASDDTGEAGLVYTWETVTIPAGATLTFANNGTNAAKNQQVSFTHAGVYQLKVTALDAGNKEVTSTLQVTVDEVLSVTIAAGSPTVQAGKTRQFAATVADQFGNVPATPLVWSVSGGGTINSAGLFTAGNTNGNFTVTATAGAANSTSNIQVTAGLPAAATGLAATAVTPTSIRVTWTLNDPGITAVSIMRWNGATWAGMARLEAGATSFIDYSATANTSFFYHVVTHNDVGATWAATYTGAKTPAVAAQVPPAMPTQLAATPLTHDSVKVTWKLAGDETQVVVKRWTGATWLTVATLPAGTTTFTETGLTANTQYYYDVVAQNAFGDTWAATYVGAKTYAAVAPAAPTNLAFTQVSSTSGRISWKLNGNETAVYVAKWTGTTWQTIAALPAGSTSFVDPGLWVGAKFHYMVIAANSFGQTWAQSYVTSTMV